MAEYLLIINPNSSKGKGQKKTERIRELFLQSGKDVDIAYTEREGHAETLAFSGAKKGYSAIIACGGDGSVNEVINGIMKSGRQVKMGIIPITARGRFRFFCGKRNILGVRFACRLCGKSAIFPST